MGYPYYPDFVFSTVLKEWPDSGKMTLHNKEISSNQELIYVALTVNFSQSHLKDLWSLIWETLKIFFKVTKFNLTVIGIFISDIEFQRNF